MEINPQNPIYFTDITKLSHPEKYLVFMDNLLEVYETKYYLAFGTALGLYRDKDFIPEDTDIDIAVIADECDWSFLKKLEEYPMVREVKDEGVIYQKCYQTPDLLIIDICFFYKDGDEYYTKTPQGQFRDKVDIIGKTQKIKTKYGEFSFPEKIPEYLVARYGDWQTPKHGATGSSIKV